MRVIKISLFWKFSIAIIFVVFLFGYINIYILGKIIYNSFDKEIEKRGVYIAKSVAEKVLHPIAYDDVLNVLSIINETKKMDDEIEYIIVLNNKGEVITETHNLHIPPILFEKNKLREGDEFKIMQIEYADKGQTIKDISVPLLDSKVGTVRVGLIDEEMKGDLYSVISSLLLIIACFLMVSLLFALIFSHKITSPIKKISLIADNLDLSVENLNTHSFESTNLVRKVESSLTIQDELDILMSKFSDMLIRLRNTYDELSATQSSLIHSEKLASIGILAAGIAHEINNPIAGLQNCIRRISKNPENIEQNKEYLIMITEAADRIETVIHGLLNYSRKHDYVVEDVKIVEVVKVALNLLSHKLEKQDIDIHIEAQNDLPLIKGSRNHLEQVIFNLSINSIDSIDEYRINHPDERGKILVKIFTDDQDLFVDIVDNGTGIKEENKEKIFDPFFTTKELGKGTGLGMSICYNIIKEHGGMIYIENLIEDEHGVKCIVMLPLS